MTSWKVRAEQSAAESLASNDSIDDGVTTCATRQSADGSRRFFTESQGGLCWLTGCSAFMFLAVAAAVSQAGDRTLARVLVGVVSVGGVGFCYRLNRMGIVVKGNRLTARNFWRTWSADATEIAWFEPSLRKVLFLHSGLLIKLTNAPEPRIRVVSVFGYWLLRTATGGVRQSAELTTWLVDARAGRPPRHRELVRTPLAKWMGRIGYVVLTLVLAFAAAGVVSFFVDPSTGN